MLQWIKMAAILNVFLLSLFVSKTVTYIQLVNSNTKAVSSSTYQDYVASRAVDGDTDQYVSRCFHSGISRDITEAWLRIDLGGIYSVKSVKFWLRDDGIPTRLRGYSLRVSNDTNVPFTESSCYNDPGNVTLPTIVEEDCERTARYIWIYQSNKTYTEPCPMFAICEVQVFACNDGEYGMNCRFDCSRHCLNDEVCNKIDGSCRSCADGYTGIKCNTECDAGKYGKACFENCGACLNSTVCNHITGDCELGCEPGWQNTAQCKTACNNGTYGHNCQHKCRDSCLREVCDKTDGSCISCVGGYQTDLILLIISAYCAIFMLF